MERNEQNLKSKPKVFDQPSTESGLQDDGVTPGAAVTIAVQEAPPESPSGESRDAQPRSMYQTVMAELLRIKDKDDSSSIRSFSSSEGILEDERFNEIEEDCAVLDGSNDFDSLNGSGNEDGQGEADETFCCDNIDGGENIEQGLDQKVEGELQEPEQMVSECQQLDDTLVEQKEDEPREPPQMTGDKVATAGEDNPQQKDNEPLKPPQTMGDEKLVATAGDDGLQQEADGEFVKSVQVVGDHNEAVIATEGIKQSSDDSAQAQHVSELSHEATVQEVDAIVVNEPDGTSVLNRQRDWNLLTSNMGTSLSIIKTNEDGSFKTSLEDGKEVLLTSPFPSESTVVRESHQHVQLTYYDM